MARTFGKSVESQFRHENFEQGEQDADRRWSPTDVALVYIDARGVTRRALIKAVGSSVIRAKMVSCVL